MSTRTIMLVAALFMAASVLPSGAMASSGQSLKIKDAPPGAEDAMQETISVLDTDGSGKVERSEIESFAQNAGLSSQEIQEDFAELDRDGDGALDADEITGVMALMDNAVAPAALEPMEANPLDSQALSEKEKHEESLIVQEEVSSDSEPQPAHAEHSVLPKREVKTADMKLTKLGREAESRAARTLAEAIARRAEDLLLRGAEDAKAAAKYEALAQSLRANATAALRGAAVRTKGAAREASEKVVKSVLPEVQNLQTTAASLEKQAQDHWSQARVAMERVMHHR